MAQYPWELIADDFGHLVPRGVADVTRYITYPQPPPPFDATFDDLPLLRVVSSPPGRPPITAGALPVKRVVTLERHL